MYHPVIVKFYTIGWDQRHTLKTNDQVAGLNSVSNVESSIVKVGNFLLNYKADQGWF